MMRAASLKPQPGERDTPEGDASIRVSVVVPTYRRPALLRRCMTALHAQSLDPARYEILVVDDGHDQDGTKAAVQEADLLPVVRCLRTPRPRSGPALARNIGWRAATGAVIAFTDDDCVPASQWLEKGLMAFHDPRVAGASGRIVVPLTADPTDYERTTAGLERAPFATANCFYRAQALELVGGFDERFTAAWREDSDVQFALMERGALLVVVPEAVVVHPVRPASWGISVRQQRNNMFNALLFKKHRDLYRRCIQPSAPWRYYANAAALAGTAVGWSLESLWLVGPLLAWWLADVWRFALRRLRHTSRRARHVAEMLVTSAVIPPLAVYWRLRGALRYRVLFL